MEFGIFNLMGARDPRTPTTQIFSEVSEQVALADRLGYCTAWFAEHQTAAGHGIGGGDLRDQPHWIVERHDDDCSA